MATTFAAPSVTWISPVSLAMPAASSSGFSTAMDSDLAPTGMTNHPVKSPDFMPPGTSSLPPISTPAGVSPGIRLTMFRKPKPSPSSCACRPVENRQVAIIRLKGIFIVLADVQFAVWHDHAGGIALGLDHVMVFAGAAGQQVAFHVAGLTGDDDTEGFR